MASFRARLGTVFGLLFAAYTCAALLALPLTTSAAPPVEPDAGFAASVEQGAQLNFGTLGIGVGSVTSGPYLDEKHQRRVGPYASLSIAVDGQPSLFQQPDVHEGQTLVVAGYRILIEKLILKGRGLVVLKVWAPSKS